MKFWHNPLGSIIKIVCSATLVGSLAGFVFPFLLRIFSIDQSLSLWELLVSFIIAILILGIVGWLVPHIFINEKGKKVSFFLDSEKSS